jgi:argininosuccinate lyase
MTTPNPNPVLNHSTSPTHSTASATADNQNESSGMWGGRFTEATDAFVAQFTASVQFDQRLYRQDIQGSIAHATMLASVDVLTNAERDEIIQGLNSILADIEAGRFEWRIDLEDVHMNIEHRLTNMIGITGKKLHTGRSRNDQVATDIRLYLRDEIDQLMQLLAKLERGILTLASAHTDTIMPGFTHLQTAQPVTFGHHLMAWFEMLLRDGERLIDLRRRVNRSPLGSAALAGTTYPINREYTAQLLGFEAVCENSLDAVSDRDFAIEFTSAAALIMMHLSRISEELVLWTSAPDVPELIRGKSGRVYGDLMSLLTLMKGQPLAYNKDNQEDKEPLFDAIDTVRGSLLAFADMIPALVPNIEVMKEAALRGFSTATDLADYLVKKNIAFRDAHEIVGKAVALGVRENRDLSELSLAELQQFSSLIEDDVFAVLTLTGSVAARNHLGGTAPNQVQAAIGRAESRLKALLG